MNHLIMKSTLLKISTTAITILLITIACKDQSNNQDSTDVLEAKLASVSPADFQFRTPALQVDFPNDSSKQSIMNAMWHTNLTGFTDQGITGNPWTATNDAKVTNYFNPADVGIPSGSANVAIQWNAFPGRIAYYYPNMSSDDSFAMADTGLLANGQMPPEIPEFPCDSTATAMMKYGPYGPRGFQDEYCEWAVRRNAAGQIIRIDFTCENPEYWNTLWNVDPNKVLELYQTTLDIPSIQMSDLYIKDANGNGIIDPSTGNYLYNPLNKWNNGTNGAMHLTSTPNTIQTEIGLGTSASQLRTGLGSDFEALLCCGQFGQKFRNSDPTIGGNVNALVARGMNATLANPPGLYIQKPTTADFQKITTPDGTDPSTFWTTLRGQESLDPVDGLSMPGNFILHAKFEVPESLGYTISDLMMNGENVSWGSQIAQLIEMHIIATGYGGSVPASMGCVETPQTTFADPLQLFYKDVFDGYKNTSVNNPAKFPMTVLSNSTYVTPRIKQGTTSASMIIVVDALDVTNGNPTVTFDGSDITATVGNIGKVTYAVPGNSYPSNYSTVEITVDVAADATTGLRNVYVTNTDQQQGVAMPALLYVEN